MTWRRRWCGRTSSTRRSSSVLTLPQTPSRGILHIPCTLQSDHIVDYNRRLLLFSNIPMLLASCSHSMLRQPSCRPSDCFHSSGSTVATGRWMAIMCGEGSFCTIYPGPMFPICQRMTLSAPVWRRYRHFLQHINVFPQHKNPKH